MKQDQLDDDVKKALAIIFCANKIDEVDKVNEVDKVDEIDKVDEVDKVD